MSDISESIIMRWLDRFGPLPETLLYTMVGEKNQYALNKILKSNQYGFINTRAAYSGDVNIYGLPTQLRCYSYSWEEQRRLFTGKLPKMSDTQKEAYENSNAVLVMNNWDNEIAVFYKGEENKLRTLVVDSYTNYIFVIPSCEAIDTFMTQINRLNIPCSQFRFAVVEHQDKKKRPIVNIYKIEEGAA